MMKTDVTNVFKKPKKIRDTPPRPANPFILYAVTQRENMKGLPTSEQSKIIGKRWNKLGKAQKMEWRHTFEREREAHAQKYPGYVYRPSKEPKKKGSKYFKKVSPKKNTTIKPEQTFPKGSLLGGDNGYEFKDEFEKEIGDYIDDFIDTEIDNIIHSTFNKYKMQVKINHAIDIIIEMILKTIVDELIDTTIYRVDIFLDCHQPFVTSAWRQLLNGYDSEYSLDKAPLNSPFG